MNPTINKVDNWFIEVNQQSILAQILDEIPPRRCRVLTTLL